MKKYEHLDTVVVDQATRDIWKMRQKHGDSSRIAKLSKGKFSRPTVGLAMLTGRGNYRVINAINKYYENRK